MKTKIFLLSVFLTSLFSLPTLSAQSILRPVQLRCEYLETPLGIDAKYPRLMWKLKDSRQGAKQTAYQIQISTDSVFSGTSNRAEVWDSGRKTSADNLVSYNGKPLEAFTKYFWRVTIWDKDGKQAAPVVSSFETGMVDMKNWQGNWISDRGDINKLPAPYFRKSFNAGKTVKSARAYIAAGGLYELYLNGKKVGNHRLDPMYTRFDRRNLYVSYDVTPQVKNGDNAIGVLLGNGWYNHQSLAVWNFDKAPWRNRPTFCLDLRITYTDGTTEVVYTDQSWKTHDSPIVFNSIYTAEHYDARLEQKGWNTAGFDDSKWKGSSLRAAPSRNVVSQAMHPIRNVETIPAKSIKKINDTTYLFDLGRNIAGVSQIKVRGERGTRLSIAHGERLKPNGRLDLSNIDVYYKPVSSNDPFQTDIFTLSGEGEEEFMAKFNYKGFQYVEVTSNKPVQLDQKSIIGHFMHSDVPVTGEVKSSSEMINKLWWATNNSYLSNLFGYPTDCPQREKNGWTGDGHFAIETGLYNFDGITVYEKWLADHQDEQQPNGVLPDIIPTGGWGYGTANGTDWTSTIAIIPWNIYMFYGDSRLLHNVYPNIKSYVNYVTQISPNGLTTWGRGDWVPVKSESPLEYTSSVYYYADAVILAKAAKLFGYDSDYQEYTALAEKIKKAINDKYFHAEKGIYGTGLQTELSVALFWGIVPEELKASVAEKLAERVKADHMHLDVGVLGAKAILNALSENGQSEIAYQLAVQDTYPSWGWWIANGATTLYENWNIQAERDISLNHMMFGEIGGWFFKGLGGIMPDEKAPGFKHIRLMPHFSGNLAEFEASHNGPQGLIRSSWKKKGKQVSYQVTVPANSSATVYFPLKAGQSAWLGKKKLPAQFEIEAGEYQFEIR
ncbi:alpha-rhamnosidase [Pedobacter antarcticus 4BY]|uniref:alpha-L-rhamnosidase n=2 Tax=Pedobacter antarcticus TaxID=34086 RepID=A0A081PBM7_9SPHI|nr:alpha-L-rhamnosidase [Pedobacter antarcticus]KEQ28100.1 alpha-rhamnosidase [Pedobacter antarcticus 4BY]SFE41911.1 alpha-L-rhamnosidase [Pedobacter antarcticus]